MKEVFRTLFSLFVVILSAVVIASCDDGGGDDEGNGGGGGSSDSSYGVTRVTISSDDVLSLGSASLGGLKPATSCTLANGDVNASGECVTPVSMSAKVTQLNLGHANGGVPGRLIQFNAGPGGYDGPQGVLGLAEYDFADSAQATNPYSDDNFGESEAFFNTVTLQMGSIDVKLNVAADSTNPYWTIRYSFYPQNPADDSNLTSCISADTGLQSAVQSSGDIFSAPDGFQAGDIMVCQKSSSTAACADSDFQFIDSADGSLSSTRPSSPVALDGTYLWGGENNSCNEQDGGNISLEIQPVNFQTRLATGSEVKIYKTRSANDCLFQYTYNTTCTSTSNTAGSCSSADTQAFGIDASVDFDLTDAVFVPSSIDLDSTATTTILQAMDQILPRPIYFEEFKTAQGTGYTTGVSATVTITSNDSLATDALTSRGDNPDHYDSNFCFIEGSE